MLMGGAHTQVGAVEAELKRTLEGLVVALFGNVQTRWCGRTTSRVLAVLSGAHSTQPYSCTKAGWR
jgi:hypothetical protein